MKRVCRCAAVGPHLLLLHNDFNLSYVLQIKIGGFYRTVVKEPPGDDNSAEEKEQQRSSSASGHRCSLIIGFLGGDVYSLLFPPIGL